MSAGVRQKDPASIVNFTLDWSDHLTALGGLTIASSDWTVPAGITEVTASNTTTATTVRLSGGTHGADYEIVNHVVFSDGQEEERALTIQVRQVEAGASVDATERANALSLLTRWVQPDTAPELTQTEIESTLDDNRRASVWAASTAYVPGSVIVPTVKTGRRYRCIVGGTSGATEPFTGSERWPTADGARVTEGDSSPQLTWQEDGPEYTSLYDIRQAAYECCDLKAQKSAQFIQAGDLHMEMVYEHWVKQRDNFMPMGFA